MIKNFTTINKRIYVIRINGTFFNYSLINVHAPTNESEEEAKNQFYEQLERVYAAWLSHEVKLVMGSKHNLHDSTNEDGLGLAFVQKKGKAARRRGFNRDCATSEYSGL
jgi:hypothetical protein